MKKIFLTSLCFLAACSESTVEYGPPPSRSELRNQDMGKLFGDDFLVFGKDKKKEDESSIGVNAFLWRATLDTLSSMPMRSADPQGGVILTEWYEATPHERMKVDVLILSKNLRSDAIKVTTFKQVKDATGQWKDQPSNPHTGQQLENAILQRSRELKAQAGS